MSAIDDLPKYNFFERKQKKGFTYFYQYDGNEWLPGVKYSKKVNPKIIGKIPSGGGNGIIQFTPEFVKSHPIFTKVAIERRLSPENKWELRELSQENEGNKIFTEQLGIKQHDCQSVLRIGTYLLYMQLLRGDPLLLCLKQIFPNTWEKLLSVAFYCIDKSNSLIARHYERYCTEYKLPFQENLTPKKLTELFQSVSEVDVYNFFACYTNTLFSERSLKRRRFWALDSTSISTYSKLIDASYGHNKQEENLPQINVMMLTDELSGRPLFYETFDGSIPDVAKAFSVFDSLLHIGAKAFVAVMDRGFYSLYNLQGIVDLGFHFVVCVPIDKVTLFKPAILEASTAFLCGDHFNSALDQNVYSTSQEVPVKVKGKNKVLKLFVHIFYDQEKAGAQTKAIQRRRCMIMKMLKDQVTLDADNQKFADTYLIQNDDGSITINNHAFQEANNKAGIFVVVSDCVDDGQTAYQAFKGRKVVEDCFTDLKVRMNCSRFLVGSEESLVGKIFVEFIALSLYMRIMQRIYRLQEKGRTLPHHDVPGILEDLKGIKVACYGDGYIEVLAISHRQRECLKMFHIKPPVSGYPETIPLPNMHRYARKPHGDGNGKLVVPLSFTN